MGDAAPIQRGRLRKLPFRRRSHRSGGGLPWPAAAADRPEGSLRSGERVSTERQHPTEPVVVTQVPPRRHDTRREQRIMTSTLLNSAAGVLESREEIPLNAERGDLTLLGHPVAQQLLHSRLPVRLAYIARDATPRVVPMQFHWTGEVVVVSCWPDDPKAPAIRAHP